MDYIIIYTWSVVALPMRDSGCLLGDRIQVMRPLGISWPGGAAHTWLSFCYIKLHWPHFGGPHCLKHTLKQNSRFGQWGCKGIRCWHLGQKGGKMVTGQVVCEVICLCANVFPAAEGCLNEHQAPQQVHDPSISAGM